MENHFEIMDHEVENHTDVGAAPGISRKPVRLDETGPGQLFLEGVERRIEALDMADLQHKIFGVGKIDERLRLLGVVGDWLFNQDMLAEAEKEGADFMVCVGGRRDGGGIDLLGEFLRRAEGLYAVPLRDFLCDMGVNVVEADELDSR
jgi:hypothetical protein